jgi:hypothetical protein
MLAERFGRFRDGQDYKDLTRTIEMVQELTEAAPHTSSETTQLVSPIIAKFLSKIDSWIFRGIAQPRGNQAYVSVVINPLADRDQVGGMQH